jgi:signal transduction histidine kinase
MKRPLASLRSRIFTATAVVAVLPIAAALAFVTRRAGQQAEAELARGTAEAAGIVEQYHRTRLELAAERATLVADLPKLKAAVHEADPRTVEPVARDYRGRVRADVFVVADREGRTLVALGAGEAGWPAGAQAPYQVLDGRLLETVTAPIQLGTEAPELLGRLTLAFALDGAFALRLRALTGSHVAVIHRGRVFASSLPGDLDAALLAHAATASAVQLPLAGEDYEAARASLGQGEDAPFALVLRSRREALRPFRTLRTALGLAALGAVAVSVLLSWAVARTVTRPLSALTDTMKQIAATGDLGRRIGPGQPWDDEDARLLASAFGALTESIARFQREAALRDRLAALGRLSTVIAHEVRNPLMIIKGSLRALKRAGATEAEIREAAGDIEQEVARLNRIVGDVLDFARPLRLSVAPVDVTALAGEAARAALEGADGIGARLVLAEGASLLSDGERLRAVLVNLIENARDSVAQRRSLAGLPPAGGDAIEVGSRRLEAGRVLLWVLDQGVGIPEADLPHVFEPYFTTKRTGTGLGLAIARKVVEALGGALRLESRSGQGTRIEIELPAEPPAAATEGR